MDGEELTRGMFRVLETGDVNLAVAVVAESYVNRESWVSPPACQRPGPAAALATGAWLRSTYSGLAYPVVDVVDRGDQVWSRVRMQGRQTGPFARFRDGRPDQVFPPSDRDIDVEHVHIFTVRDGQIVRHEAVRDDVTMLRQLGYLPPTPRTIARIAGWRLSGRATSAARRVADHATEAADAVRSIHRSC